MKADIPSWAQPECSTLACIKRLKPEPNPVSPILQDPFFGKLRTCWRLMLFANSRFPNLAPKNFMFADSGFNPWQPNLNILMPPKAAVNRQPPDFPLSAIFYPLLLQLCDQESPAVSVPSVPLIMSAPPFPKNP